MCIRDSLGKERLREAAVKRYKHRLVLLVAVAVQHEQDLTQAGIHLEQARHVVRVLQRQVRRQQRLGHTAAVLHRI